MSRQGHRFRDSWPLALAVALLGLSACEFVVDVDRTRIGADAQQSDIGVPSRDTGVDSDVVEDAGDAALDASDASDAGDGSPVDDAGDATTIDGADAASDGAALDAADDGSDGSG